MSALAYDTLKLSKALEAASVTPAQAEGLTKALTDSSLSNFATKQDFLQLEMALSAKIAAVEAKITAVEVKISTIEVKISSIEVKISALDVSVSSKTSAIEASVTAQIASLKVELVKWIVAAIAFNFIGTAGLVIALVRGLK